MKTLEEIKAYISGLPEGSFHDKDKVIGGILMDIQKQLTSIVCMLDDINKLKSKEQHIMEPKNLSDFELVSIYNGLENSPHDLSDIRREMEGRSLCSYKLFNDSDWKAFNRKPNLVLPDFKTVPYHGDVDMSDVTKLDQPKRFNNKELSNPSKRVRR